MQHFESPKYIIKKVSPNIASSLKPDMKVTAAE